MKMFNSISLCIMGLSGQHKWFCCFMKPQRNEERLSHHLDSLWRRSGQHGWARTVSQVPGTPEARKTRDESLSEGVRKGRGIAPTEGDQEIPSRVGWGGSFSRGQSPRRETRKSRVEWSEEGPFWGVNLRGGCTKINRGSRRWYAEVLDKWSKGSLQCPRDFCPRHKTSAGGAWPDVLFEVPMHLPIYSLSETHGTRAQTQNSVQYSE